MTILPWPADSNQRRPTPDRELIVDPLPQKILHSLVSDLPGPRGETETERAARFQAQLAEVLSYKPRNSAEAMLATHCVMLRLLADDSRRDTARPNRDAAIAKKLVRDSKQMHKLLDNMEKTLTDRQSQSLGKMDVALAVSLGLGEFLIPNPDDPDRPEEAYSATIVPLHPAPKMLQ
jgi:hypothetical protein